MLDPKRVGILGEETAAAHYWQQEYIIVDSNYTCRFGEVDFIAWKEDLLVFVEVRTRRAGSMLTPAETVDSHKQHRIIAAAKHFLMVYPEYNDCRMRFDVVEATYLGGYRCSINCIEDAFTL